jgi:hypothetical protein
MGVLTLRPAPPPPGSASGGIALALAIAGALNNASASGAMHGSVQLGITVTGFAETPTVIYQQDGAGGAYTTLAMAVAMCGSADVLQLRANTPGGEVDIDECLALRDLDFDPPLRIRIRPGDTVKINNQSGDQYEYWSWTDIQVTGRLGIFIQNCSGIDISGGVLGALQLGDRDEWSPSDPYDRSQARCLQVENSSNITLDFLYGTGGWDWVANRVARDCDNVTCRDWDFRYHHFNAPDDGSDGAGDMIRIDGTNNVVERVHTDHSGHDCVVLEMHESVVRECEFDGYWGDIDATFYGTRCCVIAPANNTGRIPTMDTKPGISGRLLVEYCTFKRAGPNQRDFDQLWQPGIKLMGNGVIVRFCNFFDLAAHVGHLQDPTGFEYVDLQGSFSDGGNRFYNNTIRKTRGLFAVGSASFMTHPLIGSDTRVFNNIISEIETHPDSDTVLRYTVSYDSSEYPNGSFSSVWRDWKIHDNIFEMTSGVANDRIYAWANGEYAQITDAELNHPEGDGDLMWPDDVFGNIVYDVPTMEWANGTTDPERTDEGLAITDWGPKAAAGTAAPHSLITATSSGTVISVSDPRSFFDGFGRDDQLPDLIGIGANAAAAAANAVRIAAGGVDIDDMTLTLATSKSVTNGQKIWIFNRDSALADNHGCAQ